MVQKVREGDVEITAVVHVPDLYLYPICHHGLAI